MSQKHNRSMSFSLYICVLAVSDTVVLTIGKFLIKFWKISVLFGGTYTLDFKAKVDSLACMLLCLHALDSSGVIPGSPHGG